MLWCFVLVHATVSFPQVVDVIVETLLGVFTKGSLQQHPGLTLTTAGLASHPRPLPHRIYAWSSNHPKYGCAQNGPSAGFWPPAAGTEGNDLAGDWALEAQSPELDECRHFGQFNHVCTEVCQNQTTMVAYRYRERSFFWFRYSSQVLFSRFTGTNVLLPHMWTHHRLVMGLWSRYDKPGWWHIFSKMAGK